MAKVAVLDKFANDAIASRRKLLAEGKSTAQDLLTMCMLVHV
jgi:hypothetical protein